MIPAYFLLLFSYYSPLFFRQKRLQVLFLAFTRFCPELLHFIYNSFPLLLLSKSHELQKCEHFELE